MSSPQFFQELEGKIRQEFPEATLSIDTPTDSENGVWYLDVVIKGRRHVVGWKKGKEIGLASDVARKGMAYGEGWPETFETPAILLDRMKKL